MKFLRSVFCRKEISGRVPCRVIELLGLHDVHCKPLNKLVMKAGVKPTDQLVKQGKSAL